MSNSRMSVAICTYNGGKFLPEQLESIASQVRPPDEVVVCDDGSCDNTVVLLEAFADRVSFPVRIVLNEQRLGPAKNFEKAISLCDGEIIVLSDQDDIWRSEKLRTLAEAFDRNRDAAYVFSDADMIDEVGAPTGRTTWDAVGFREHLSRFYGVTQLEVLLRQNVIIGASMAFRASFREIIAPIPSGWMHDYWIVLLGSALSQGIAVPERLLMYRRHASQVCGWRKAGFRQGIKESLNTDDNIPLSKLEQFRELRRRIDSVQSFLRCPPDRRALILQKETHLLKRADLRSTRGLSRIRGVLAEAFTGRYRRYSNSWFSMVRDLT